MERRSFLSKLAAGLAIGWTTFTGICQKVVEAADSWFYWPSYPSTEALRRHLASSSRHKEYDWADVKGKSRSQLIAMHDRSHFRQGNKAPLRKTK